MPRSISSGGLTSSQCGTPTHDSYERPPGSALLSTFQRLGVSHSAGSSSAMLPETKRLRLSSQRSSPIDIDLAQHQLASPGARSATPPATGSPCPPSTEDQNADFEMSAQHCRSPTDLERLSPVSHLLLCSRPGQLQRHLAVPRAHPAGDVTGVTATHAGAVLHGLGSDGNLRLPHAGMGVIADGMSLAPLGPPPSRTLSAPANLDRRAEAEAAMVAAAVEAAQVAAACADETRPPPRMIPMPSGIATASTVAPDARTPLPTRRLARHAGAHPADEDGDEWGARGGSAASALGPLKLRTSPRQAVLGRLSQISAVTPGSSERRSRVPPSNGASHHAASHDTAMLHCGTPSPIRASLRAGLAPRDDAGGIEAVDHGSPLADDVAIEDTLCPLRAGGHHPSHHPTRRSSRPSSHELEPFHAAPSRGHPARSALEVERAAERARAGTPSPGQGPLPRQHDAGRIAISRGSSEPCASACIPPLRQPIVRQLSDPGSSALSWTSFPPR